MRQVIDRKIYDTESTNVTKVAEYHNCLSRSDFRCIEETLYITQKGQFFMEYWGGAATHYAERAGNWSSEGSGIKVLNNEEAYDWLERHNKIDAVEKYFSDELEDA